MPKRELSKFDKVLLSNTYIHSSNYYIPEDRTHLQRKLNNLVDDVQEKHEEILKENEECFRVLDWINEMSKKPLSFESIDKDGLTHNEKVSREIEELRKDNGSLSGQLDASKDALEKASLLNKELRKRLDEFLNPKNDISDPNSNKNDLIAKEIETYRNENKNLEKQIEKLKDQNKKKIKEYLESLEEPVDLDQLGKSFHGLTDDYKGAIKQFHEEKKNLIFEINDANDEYADLVKANFRQQKKKLEMQNEIEALNNLIDNNTKLKDDIEKANNKFKDTIGNQNEDLLKDIKNAEDELDKLENE